jgi:hypothetical protein
MAQFEALRCQVNFHFRSAKGRSRKSQLPKKTLADCAGSEDADHAPTKHSYSRRGNPKRSRKATVAQEESTNSNLSSTPDFHIASNDDIDQPEDIESLVSKAIADMASLLDLALRKVIGVRGSSPGFRTLKGTSLPTLIDIAPAVWDLQYLQVRTTNC